MGSSYKPTGRKNGVRKRIPGVPYHTEEVRAKIKASLLIHRLQAHIFEGLELSMSQIKGIEILLRKCLPDLTTTTVTAEFNVRYVAELPPMLSREEWEKKYSIDHLDPNPKPLAITNGSGNLQ